MAYRTELAGSLANQKAIGVDVSKVPEFELLNRLAKVTSVLLEEGNAIVTLIHDIHAHGGDTVAEAEMCSAKLVPMLERVRIAADAVEELVADKQWPYPKYTELLF